MSMKILCQEHGLSPRQTERLNGSTLNDDDKSLVLSLVRHHVLTSDEYMSFVPGYYAVTWVREEPVTRHVRGYFRRKPYYKRIIQALNCTCKLDELALPCSLDVVKNTEMLNMTIKLYEQIIALLSGEYQPDHAIMVFR